jgi:hypothetical protein
MATPTAPLLKGCLEPKWLRSVLEISLPRQMGDNLGQTDILVVAQALVAQLEDVAGKAPAEGQARQEEFSLDRFCYKL